MSYYSYLKRERFTGRDISKLYFLLVIYQKRFDDIVFKNRDRLPEKQDIESVSFAFPRRQVAMKVKYMLKKEFNIKNNEKYFERVFKGGKMYLLANDIDAMQRFCECNYNLGVFEDKEVYEKKRDYSNLLSPENNKVLLQNWRVMSDGLSEILYILFNISPDFYHGDEEHIRFISELNNVYWGNNLKVSE